MEHTNKRMLFMLLSVLILIAAVVFYSYFVKPAYFNVKNLRGELASKQQDLEYYKNTVDKVRVFMEQYGKDQNIKNKISLMIPDESDVGNFANQIIGLAGINAITIKSLNIKVNPIISSDISAVKDLGSLTANVSAVGTYAGLKAFAKQISNNILIMDIKKMNIKKSNLKDGGDLLNYNFSITSYYQSD